MLTTSPHQPLPYVDPLLMPTMILGSISMSSFAFGKIVDYLQKPIDPNQLVLGIPEIKESESALVNTFYMIGFVSAICGMVLACEP